jgi:hypothetical protein
MTGLLADATGIIEITARDSLMKFESTSASLWTKYKKTQLDSFTPHADTVAKTLAAILLMILITKR